MAAITAVAAGAAAPQANAEAALDISRLTQGLEYDASGDVADFVAGKDTLMRFQLAVDPDSRVLNPFIDAVNCVVERDGELVARIPAFWSRPLVHFQSQPVSLLNANRPRRFDGSPHYDCWFNGQVLPRTGRYVFKAEVYENRPGGGEPQVIRLATAEFVPPAADIRMMITAGLRQTTDPLYAPLTDELFLEMVDAMWDVQRALPVRAGVEFWGASRPQRSGLSFHLVPTFRCADLTGTTCNYVATNTPVPALPTIFQAWNRLEQLAYPSAPQYLNSIHGWAVSRANPNAGGSQRPCAAGWQIAHGGSLYADGTRRHANIITHEYGHCLGLTDPSSRHSAGPGIRHTAEGFIPLLGNRPMINMRKRTEEPRPWSMMNAFIDSRRDGDDRFIPLPDDWNTFRVNAIDRDRRGVVQYLPRQSNLTAKLAANGDALKVTGSAALNGDMHVDYSKRVTGTDAAPTESDPNGAYRAVLYNANFEEVASVRFGLAFEHPDGVSQYAGFDISVPLPDDAASLVLENASGTAAYARTFTQSAPSLLNVDVTDVKGDGRLVTWKGSDPDGDELRYSVYYTDRSGATVPIAAGLGSESFLLPTELMAANPNGRIFVEASDGLNTGFLGSTTFAVERQPPLVKIESVPAKDLVEGVPVGLTASAFDLTDGFLDRRDLVWRLDGKRIGTDDQLIERLPDGRHRLTLTVTNDAGMKASDTTRLRIAADSDKDGLPNSYERAHPCLKRAKKKNLVSDVDGDGLAAHAERDLGLNPCRGDSDRDGTKDGREVFGGTKGGTG